MPEHKVPPVTVSLGTVLDAVVEHRGTRYTVTRWKGMHLLTDPGAMDSARPRLFLVRGKLGGKAKLAPDADAGDASDTYREWHRRQPAQVGELDTHAAKYPQGRMVMIGYRSDKWGRRGKTHDYSHDFHEDGGKPPLVYTDTRALDAARTVVVVGGSMLVTDRGIA
jgi:hypothetical protein